MEKLENVLRNETTNPQTALIQITIRGDWWAPGDCQYFCIKACIKKGNLAFIIMYGKFWFDGDFFVQNLDAFRLNVWIQFSEI